jgi:YggT family protein
MFVVANLITAVAKVLEITLTILYWLILIRALLSWVNPDPFNPIVQFLYKTTEPFLNLVKKIFPFCFIGGIDISPVIAFLIIFFTQLFVVRTLMDIGYRMYR